MVLPPRQALPFPNGKLYQSPPGSGGNDGAMPTAHDPSAKLFTNLTPAQVVAFNSFPQALMQYAKDQRWQAEISGITVGGVSVTTFLADQQKIAGLKQAVDNGAITNTTNFFDANGNVQALSAAQVTGLYQAVVAFVQATYNTAATLVNDINANPPTITTRAQIDAAYAAIAPNSPSAKNPSVT